MKGKLLLIMIMLMSVLSLFAFAQADEVMPVGTNTDMPMNMLAGGALGGLLVGAILFIIILGLIVYVYQAITLMIIAKKTDTPNAWLAWIPIANVYLMTQVGRTPWWTIFGIFLAIIPWIGGLLVGALAVYWWWFIAKRRGFPEWFGILTIIPIVNWVIMGVLAWGNGSEAPKTLNTSKEPPMNPDVARIRKYASDAMAAGKGINQIKKELKDAGWSDDVIKKAF